MHPTFHVLNTKAAEMAWKTCRHAGRGSADLTVYLIKVQRLGGDLHFELGSRLIYQVNGLVWQKPVCNISV